MDITQLQKHTGFLRIIDSPIKMSGTFYVTTEANKVIEGVSEVNRIAALEIAALQAEVDELIKMLDRGGIGLGGLIIQTSDQPAVIKWRKESQALIKKIRSK